MKLSVLISAIVIWSVIAGAAVAQFKPSLGVDTRLECPLVTNQEKSQAWDLYRQSQPFIPPKKIPSGGYMISSHFWKRDSFSLNSHSEPYCPIGSMQFDNVQLKYFDELKSKVENNLSLSNIDSTTDSYKFNVAAEADYIVAKASAEAEYGRVEQNSIAIANGYLYANTETKAVSAEFTVPIACYLEPYENRFNGAFKNWTDEGEKLITKQIESARFNQYDQDLARFDDNQYCPDPTILGDTESMYSSFGSSPDYSSHQSSSFFDTTDYGSVLK